VEGFSAKTLGFVVADTISYHGEGEEDVWQTECVSLFLNPLPLEPLELRS